MTKRNWIAVAIAALPSCALAEPTRLTGDKLRDTIAGRTIILDTPVGGLPIRHAINGTLTGKATGLALAASPKVDSGRWWITSGQVCQQWRSWLGGQRYCYHLRRNGSTLYWRRNDGETGTARLTGN